MKVDFNGPIMVRDIMVRDMMIVDRCANKEVASA